MAADGDGRWVADGVHLRPGDTVQVAAGGVHDDGGNVNGAPSKAVEVVPGPPPSHDGGVRGGTAAAGHAASATPDTGLASLPSTTLAGQERDAGVPGWVVRALVVASAVLAGGTLGLRRAQGRRRA